MPQSNGSVIVADTGWLELGVAEPEDEGWRDRVEMARAIRRTDMTVEGFSE